MEIKVTRDVFTDSSTTGQLFIDDDPVPQCFTLEDVDRKLEDGGVKEYGRTAIPRGRYQVILDWSPHFGRDVPHILDVPQFEGVRIHPGNGPQDTEGCLLVGTDRVPNYIRNSRLAFDNLLAKLNAAWTRGEEVWLTIT